MVKNWTASRGRRILGSDYFEIRFLHMDQRRCRLEALDSQGRRVEDETDSFEVLFGPRCSEARPLVPASSKSPETSRDLGGESGDSRLECDGIGLRLFEWLFPAKIKTFFDKDAGRAGDRLCLVLSFDLEKPLQRRLFSLPWERLRDETEPWVLNKHPIARRLLVSHEEPEPSTGRRLRILAIPVAGEGLDLDRERRSLERIRDRGGPFDLEIARQSPSINDLRDLLESGNFHVLHIMGHGRWDPWQEDWALELGKETVDSERLGMLLADQALSLRLVVLNTCHGARIDDPTSPDPHVGDGLGLAGELVRRGVPAVLANRTAIGDTAAYVLTRGLYRRLARRDSLDQALSRARLDLQSGESGVSAQEWATPVLLLRAIPRRTRGHILELPDPAEPFPVCGALGLGLLAVAFLGLGATAAAYLAHLPELLAGAISFTALLVRVVWGWLQRSDPDHHPLHRLASYMEDHLRWSYVVATMGLLTAMVFWSGWGYPRFQDLPCRREAVGDFDPTDRAVALEFQAQDSTVVWPEPWQRDLRHTLRRSGLKPVIENRLREKTTPTCFAWRVKATSARDEAGQPSSAIEVFRRADLQASWQEPQSPESITGLAGDWLISVLDPRNKGLVLERLSPPTRAGLIEAMILYGEGELQAAADLLEELIHRDRDAPLLRNNLAQVLLDLAREKRRHAATAPKERKAALEDEALELTLRASRHLEQALQLDPKVALYHYNHGRVLVDLGRAEEGAEAFQRALRWAPGFPEAANDLAVLLIEKGRPAHLKKAVDLLERAELWVSKEDLDTQTAILSHLGRAYLLSGDLSRAWRALDTAECRAPMESFRRRAEILFHAAQVHEALLGPATAAVTWRRYGELLEHDLDPAHRREFFRWRSRHTDQLGSDRVLQGPWVDRCRGVDRAF